jgi:hypothetical protein
MHTTLPLLQPALLLQLAALPTAAGSEFIIHAVLAPITLLSCVYAHTVRAVSSTAASSRPPPAYTVARLYHQLSSTAMATPDREAHVVGCGM